MLFLCPERAFHRSGPHSDKFLSDKVLLLFLLTERTASFLRKMSVFRSPYSRPCFQFTRSPYLLQYLAEQVKQPACDLPRLAPVVLALFLYVRFAFCTSRDFVRGRWFRNLLLNSLVLDVAVQLFPQFRAAESRVHLQEHKGNFSLRSEERLASQLRPHAFPYQTEVLCHLAER